jgi:transcriptional regulator with XRE-family HTH domain
MSDDPALTMGAKLRRLRLACRLSLEEAATQAGASKSHLSDLENGRVTDPSVRLVQRLAAGYGVSVEYLIDPTLARADSAADHAFITEYRRASEEVRQRFRDGFARQRRATQRGAPASADAQESAP